MRLNFNEIITLSSSSLPPLYNSCFAGICLADTWIKSGLIGQNVCQGSAAFICHVLVLIIMIGRIFDQDSYDKNSYVNIVMYYCKLDKHDGGLFYKFKIKSQWKISKKGWVSLATHRALCLLSLYSKQPIIHGFLSNKIPRKHTKKSAVSALYNIIQP